jgi:glutathione S-transferase
LSVRVPTDAASTRLPLRRAAARRATRALLRVTLRAMQPVRLVTIGFSHYCEKARWALERAGVPFVEEKHVPVLSWRGARGAGGERTLPVLVTPDGVLSDSTDILRWVDATGRAAPLFPEGDEQTARLEARFDEVLGPATRRYVYDFLLGMDDATLGALLGVGAPAWQRGVARTVPWMFARLMRRGMNVVPAAVARSRARIDEVFAEVESLLADGRPYLTGERFTAADLTFASLAAPVVYPDAYARFALPLTRFPASLHEVVTRFRETPAGRYALRVYAQERG